MQFLVQGRGERPGIYFKINNMYLFALKFSRKTNNMYAFKTKFLIIKFLLQNTVWSARANTLTLIREVASTQEIIPVLSRCVIVIIFKYSMGEV